MNFGFSEEQELLRGEVDKLLAERCALPAVRKMAERPEGYEPELWQAMGELGWLGLVVPEANGGAGLAWVEAIVLLERAARVLCPLPLASHLLACAALAEHGDEAQRARLLPRLASGDAVGTVALLEADGPIGPKGVQLSAEPADGGYVLCGEKHHVHDATAAGLFVVAFRGEGEVALAAVAADAPGLSCESFPVIDTTRRMGVVRLDGVRVAAEDVLVRGDAALERLLSQGAVAMTAEILGAAEAVHALTVDYACDRIQFDRPIGQCQGVKHPLAEMYVDIETFKSLLYHAAWAVGEAPAELARAAAMAKAYASDAFARVGIDCIQLHGAIGYTDEYDAQLYLKRSKWARPAFGDSDHHYERVAALGGMTWTST